MNADAPQTTEQERAGWLRRIRETEESQLDTADLVIRRLIAHVNVLAAQNGDLTAALRRIKQDKCYCDYHHQGLDDDDPYQCPHEIADALLSGQPVDTEVARLRERLEARSRNYHEDDEDRQQWGWRKRWEDCETGMCVGDRAALSGEAGERRE